MYWSAPRAAERPVISVAEIGYVRRSEVVIADIAPGGDTAKMVEQAGRQALVCSCDVSSVDAVKMLASDVTKHFGRCDILVNCAGWT